MVPVGVPSKPCRLTLRVIARVLFDLPNGDIERCSTIEVCEEFRVAHRAKCVAHPVGKE